jgi:hypothetical protein
MEWFRYLQPSGVWGPGAPLVIEDGALQGLRGTMLGYADTGIVVAVTLADRMMAVELDAAAVRLDIPGSPVAVTIH